MAAGDTTTGIQESILALLAKSPQFLFLLGAARLSGQGWLYLLVTYNEIPENRLKFINNNFGITILGLLSFVPALLIMHSIVNGIQTFEYDTSLRIIASTVVVSLGIQLIVLLATVYRNAR